MWQIYSSHKLRDFCLLKSFLLKIKNEKNKFFTYHAFFDFISCESFTEAGIFLRNEKKNIDSYIMLEKI